MDQVCTMDQFQLVWSQCCRYHGPCISSQLEYSHILMSSPSASTSFVRRLAMQNLPNPLVLIDEAY
ncbi:hypothetical protein Bhyg_07918 [Pseudolycoriella hygida]|uniref:Uncharacterized protein n=1 Tax=Pseudolycoriella hygida TaxID=35572 RepID=A0A9Q0N4E4_9DIPT|nr:hypothetical protein Bhyg_07918 [Pseudolycoriella hygida]